MRIVHVCPLVGEQLGGSERFVTNISRMQSDEHEVHIYTTTKYPNRIGRTIVDGVTIHRVYAPITIWNIDPLCIMAPQLMKSHADILHIHSYLYTISAQAILAKLVRKTKALLQLHGGLGPPPYETTFTRRIVKQIFDSSIGSFIIRNSDMIASVSRKDLEYVEQNYSVSPDRLQYVPNCVDTNKFMFSKTKTSGKPVLLYVGDLENWKGLNLIYKWLFEKRDTTNEQFTFRFVGQGTLYSKLQKLKNFFEMKRNGISIEILGQKDHDEIPMIMTESDALVFPSYWEGMPTVILEAMASGLPVIATPVGDIPRMLRNGERGLLIERNPESLELAVNRIISQDPEIAVISRSARSFVEGRYSIGSICQKLSIIYSTICS